MENFNLTEFCKRIFKQKEFFLTITVFSVLLFQSCHKIEINNSDALTLKSQTEKFFIVPENTSPITKRIAEVMQNQDKNHGYILNDFIKINGFAKWDKSLMTSGSTALNRVGTNDSLVLIPLVTDSSNKVKSSLLCVVSADSVDIRIISTSSYSVYQFTQHADSSLSAREVAMLFMMLNKSVFGYEMFQIHNTTLAHAILGDDARVDSNYISIRNDSITGEPTFLRAMIEPPAQTLASVTLYTTIHTSAPVYPGMGTMYSMGLYNLLGSIATNSGTSANISSWWLYGNGQQSGSSSSTSFDEGGWITHVITPGNGNNSNVNPTQLNATVVYVVSTLGLDVEEFAWLNANVARATEIKNYLVQNNNSPASKAIATHHLVRMISEPNYLTFVVSHYLTGNPNKMWWEDGSFLATYGGVNFGNWAVNYLKDNPNIKFKTFQKNYMGSSEGADGVYNGLYWENPNLTFAQIPLPTFSQFLNSFPKIITPTGGFEPMPAKNVYEDFVMGVLGNKYGDLYYTNACAIRCSFAFNNIEVGGLFPFKIPVGTQNTEYGDFNQLYIVSAKAFNAYMHKKFSGGPTYSILKSDINGNRATLNAFLDSLKTNNVNGIYSLVVENEGYSGHADLLISGDCLSGFALPANIGNIVKIEVWKLN